MKLLKHFLPFSLLMLAAFATTATSPNQRLNVTRVNKTQATASERSKASLSSWVLSGSIAARNKSKSWTAQINWVQRGSHSYQIRLMGPLGSGAVLIEKQGGLVYFRDGPKTSTSANAEQLLQKRTGVRLPVSNLYYWVRGLPAPGSVQMATRGAHNELKLLRQAGFTIEYLGYNKYGLPSLIRLQGNGVFVKLAIRQWRS